MSRAWAFLLVLSVGAIPSCNGTDGAPGSRGKSPGKAGNIPSDRASSPRKKGLAEEESGIALIMKIAREASMEGKHCDFSQTDPSSSKTFAEISGNPCPYMDAMMKYLQSGPITCEGFFIASHAMFNLPLHDYLSWMNKAVEAYKNGKISYCQLSRIVFPRTETRPDLYLKYKDDLVHGYYRRLKEDRGVNGMILWEKCLVKANANPEKTHFGRIDDLLGGEDARNIKEKIRACDMAPVAFSQDTHCPGTFVDPKAERPQWWKDRCEKP